MLPETNKYLLGLMPVCLKQGFCQDQAKSEAFSWRCEGNDCDTLQRQERGREGVWILPTCGRLASVSCRTLSPGRWPLSWNCSVPPHWCSPLHHQPAAWKAGSLLYLPLRSAQESEEKEMVRHACHSSTTCTAESVFLLKEMDLSALDSALWLRNIVSLCQPASSKVHACLSYVSYGWKQGISSQINHAKKHWFE